MCVSLKVAKFLKNYFRYDKKTLWVYSDGIKRYSLEPDIYNPISAPETIEAVEFLWRRGVKIYYVPSSKGCKGIINLWENRYELRDSFETPTEAYIGCLEFLSSFFEDDR